MVQVQKAWGLKETLMNLLWDSTTLDANSKIGFSNHEKFFLKLGLLRFGRKNDTKLAPLHFLIPWALVNPFGPSLYLQTNENRNREGEESACLFVFSVCLSVYIGSGRRRLGKRVRSDGRESTSDVASPEARSCFHRP